MNRYMPLTGIDLIPASLFIDTQAPLDVLHAMADYRIRTVTQVLENIARGMCPHLPTRRTAALVRSLVSFYLGEKGRPSLRVVEVKMTPVLEQGQVSA